MHTVYHIAAVHEPTARVVASLTPCGWVLPTFVARDSLGGGRLLAQATAALPLPATPRCLARPRIDRAAGSADVTLVADIAASPSEGDQRLVSITRLRTGAPVVAYQAVALDLLGFEGGDGRAQSTFLQPHWLRQVAAWVAETTGNRPEEVLAAADVHRAEEHRAVVTFTLEDQVLHFKGNVRTPFVEALVTRFIASRAEGFVAPTRAYDHGRGWWLTEHVDGVPLDASQWPAHLEAADAWVRLQQVLQPFHAELAALGVKRLAPGDLRAAVIDALNAVSHDPIEGPTAASVLERVEMLLGTRLAQDVPQLVLHFDAAPRNVLWHGARAVFLDLETLCVGPAAIAGELMSRRMQDVLSPIERRQLAVHAARTLLRAIDRVELESELVQLQALADLCLLASRRAQLWDSEASLTDEATRRYTWSHVSRDFVARVSGWPAVEGSATTSH